MSLQKRTAIIRNNAKNYSLLVQVKKESVALSFLRFRVDAQ